MIINNNQVIISLVISPTINVHNITYDILQLKWESKLVFGYNIFGDILENCTSV